MKHFIVTRTGFPVWLIVLLISLFSCKKKDQASSDLKITGISADTVWPGKVITINGAGFSATTSANTVRLGQISITEIVEATATTLKVKIPVDDATANARLYVKVNGEETASPKNIILTKQLDWQKAMGGIGIDMASSVVPTSDGGYIAAGQVNSADGDITGHHGNHDFWVVKLKADRSIVWQKTLGGSGSDQATSIVALQDGSCVVAGHTSSTSGDVINNHGRSDIWVVNLSATGQIVWTRTCGGAGDEYAYAILSTSDGYLVLGNTSSNSTGDIGATKGDDDLLLVKLSKDGALTGTTTWGGSAGDYGHSMAAASDGGFLMAGRTISTDGDVPDYHGVYDGWVIKLNAAGQLVWKKALGGSDNDYIHSVTGTADGGAMVTGYTTSTDGDVTNNHGGADYWVVKLNANGNMVWQKTLGGSLNDGAYAIAPAADGGCIVSGFSESVDGDVTAFHGLSDAWVVRLDVNGRLVWQKSVGGTSVDRGSCITPVSNNGFIVAGYTYSNDGDVTGNHGNIDFWLFKIWD